MQFGYFTGSVAGGAALSAGGYGGLGVTMGLLFLAAAATLVRRPCLVPSESPVRGVPALYRAQG